LISNSCLLLSLKGSGCFLGCREFCLECFYVLSLEHGLYFRVFDEGLFELPRNVVFYLLRDTRVIQILQVVDEQVVDELVDHFMAF